GSKEPKQNGDGHDGSQSEQKDGCVDRDALLPRQACGKNRGEYADRPNRKQNAQYTTSEGKRERFCKELLNQPGAARSQRRAPGQFFLAGGRACQQQSGHIGAGNEKQEADGSREIQESRANISNHGVGKRHNGSASKINLFSVLIDRKSTRLNSSHGSISYAVFCL